MYSNLYDMHTHSALSFDGNDSIMLLCERAKEMNAAGIAITDHCDIDSNELDVDKLCSLQLKQLDEARACYNQLDVIKGLEIGQGIYRKEKTQSLLNTYKYDFILGSIHNLENMEDFYFLDYKKFDIKKLLTKYFSDLLELCNWGNFDSLAHLTYPLRYIVAREKLEVDLTEYYEIIDEIFFSLIKNDRALEINTSGLFMDINDTLPNEQLIKRYKSLGGELITIGSDSHFADRIYQGIEQGYSLAHECGFECITIFKNRKPELVKIK